MIGWSVPRIWESEPVVILGTGPSLTRRQVEICIGRANILAVCSSFDLVPESERSHAWLHACDGSFWEEWPQAYDWPGIKTTMDPGAVRHGVELLVSDGDSGLADDPRYLRTGGSSAYQAAGIAVHAGGGPVILLGCDCRPGDDGRIHHTIQKRPGPHRSTFAEWCRYWRSMRPAVDARGIRVINATPGSAIDAFEKMELRKALDVACA